MRFNSYLYLSLLLLSIFSCQKEAGEGGNSSIHGKITVKEYSNGWFLGSYDGAEERVYIIYGDNNIYNDDMRTHFDGSYQFDYLYPGTYTIYTYTDCENCISGKTMISETVEITDKGQIIEVPEIKIEKY